MKVLSSDCMIFNPRREKIDGRLIVSVYGEELRSIGYKIMGSVPETLNDCAKYHPMKVSPLVAKDLPIFWRPESLDPQRFKVHNYKSKRKQIANINY